MSKQAGCPGLAQGQLPTGHVTTNIYSIYGLKSRICNYDVLVYGHTWTVTVVFFPDFEILPPPWFNVDEWSFTCSKH